RTSFSTRARAARYSDPGGRIISDKQFEDFERFNEIVARDRNVKFYFLGTTVPFVYLNKTVEKLGSKAPKFLTDLAAGIRDDLRDSWASPGNQEALKRLLSGLRKLLWKRPDLNVINTSGDIHVANAFEIWPPFFPKPFYQITTSAITNRQHLPDLLGQIIVEGDLSFDPSLGLIRRLWPEVTDPNLLCIRVTPQKAVLTLKVLPVDGSRAGDLEIVI
ncbi:MAG: hypothetical protein HC883_05395, partial [Bdellovibrionaceae bacterium]|nr:hypothetical protein [Pseudobdellovibrionaceae bacterium]